MACIEAISNAWSALADINLKKDSACYHAILIMDYQVLVVAVLRALILTASIVQFLLILAWFALLFIPCQVGLAFVSYFSYVVSCPDNNTLQVVAGFSSQCLTYDNFNCTATLTAHYKSQPFVKCDVCASGLYAHLNGCVKSCPAGYFGNSNFYCVCGGGLLTINNQCLSLIGCPIKMTYDSFSQSCLSCPFGCMSCQGSACTSCNPGYFLYISPQGIRCRRSSPLFPCDQQYGWIQGTCLVTNYTDPTLTMTTCLSNVINCKVCFPNRNDICILCLQGFYIYNNSCITGCPSGMIPYQNTCILT